MENHSDRKEFEEAVQKGQGYMEQCPVHCLKKPFIMHGSLQMEQFSEWLQCILPY